ncbi:Fumarate reductase flavoprotein subunit [Sinobacterium norvegicum]|uniref:Fumarate reductase flavoprotein subunit n=1 Tax=Sinobacterium norvegicum TaxID=1641715 RepID=A0ABM9ADW1_9GAMM|nr:FAD-dependent oxidoreductase [Sinobacterium norvegicum]CAH0991124.1 Fumarate reductase flavoprotein subunit [Sinobacterium norvegicum]
MSAAEKTVPTKAKKVSEIQQWDIETDVAIVGFGGAGSSAAIEAADAGVTVHIFEASSAAGGSTALSGGEVYLGGNGGTAMQRQFGFDDQSADMEKYLLMQHGPQSDEAKVAAYVDGGVAHFDWLVDKNIPFKQSFLDERVVEPMTDDCLIYSGNEKTWPEIEHCKPAPRAHVVQMAGMGAGKVLMQHLQKAVEDRGVNIHYDARALCLIIDEADSIVGIVVRIDGKELNVKAQGGVILCAGGFVMNEEMVKQYAPKLTRCNIPTGNPGDTGSGIQMGMSVGAAAINMHEGFASIPFYPPSTLTFGMIVTDKGQRFINEDAYHGRVGTALLEQNSERIYFIVDVDAYGDYEKLNFMNADVVATGDSIEELEQELKLPKSCLTHTMKLYNEFAEQGEDPMFHKQPAWLRPLEAPFVALDITPGRGAIFPYFTLGGLDTKIAGEVLKVDGTVIDGLYAAGRTSCGIPRRGSGYNSGISIGDATFFGRQAGIAAAARAKESQVSDTAA